MGGKTKSSDLPMGLPKPALRALRGAGVRTLSDVEKYGGGALARLHGVGPKALRILSEALAARRSSTGG